MNTTETDLVRRIMLRLGQIPGIRIFRNNTAMAWVGASKKFNSRQTVTVNAGDVLIHAARPLHAGLCTGSSDLIGFKSVVVTADMVGKTLAVFTAAEIKTASGRASKEQIAFVEMVNKFGGIGIFARSEDEAEQFLTKK